MSALPGPWVDHESQDSTPWADNDGVVKFIEFPVRIPRMSRRAFHLYWIKHHSPNVMNVTPFPQFMRKYTTSHVYPQKLPGLPGQFSQDTHFEGAAEVWLNSLQEVGDWLGHPLYVDLIQPDEPRFIAQDGSVEVIIAREERLYVPDPDMTETGLAKLFVLTRGKPGMDHDAIHAGASDHARRLLEMPSLRRRLRKLVVSHKLRPPSPDGFALADIDTVLELWFSQPADIPEFFADPAYDVVQRNEGDVFDLPRIRAIAGKVLVVHDEFSFQPSTTQPLPFGWNPA